MQQQHPPTHPRLFLIALDGFLAGFVTGLLFLASGLWRHGKDLWVMSPDGDFARAVVLRSVTVYGFLFAAIGALAAGLLYTATKPFLRPQILNRRNLGIGFVVGGITLVALANITVWWQLDVLTGLPLGAAERRNSASLHTVLVFAGGIFSAALLKRITAPVQRQMPVATAAVTCSVLALVCFFFSETAFRRSGAAQEESPTDTKIERVVLVGLDGMTFRLLSPFLRQDLLPSFRRLMDTSAWGTLLTYGTASSPQVWTTIATGHKVRRHGIDDFVHGRGGYRATPMQSLDRRVPAVWDILGSFGHRVGVVNWLITHPPEPVQGYLVSRLNVREQNRTFPPQLAAELEPLLKRSPLGRNSSDPRRASIHRVFDVAQYLQAKESLGLLALFNAAADGVQHKRWYDYEPQAFDPDLWPTPEISPEEAQRRQQAIPRVYEELDRRLGSLLNSLDQQTLLLVVSDHGQKPAKAPRATLRLDRILQELGYFVVQGGKPDYSASRAYPLVATPWQPTLRVNLNLRGRESQGRVAPQNAELLARRLAQDLRSVRFANGNPLFGKIHLQLPEPGVVRGKQTADLEIPLTRAARNPANQHRRLQLAERSLPMDNFLEIDTSIPGDHDRQGIFFAKGPGVRTGPIGQKVVTTALQEIFWNLTDKVDAIDFLLPSLRQLGILDQAATLDITPTILYALGHPRARDMAGRPLTELFQGAKPVQWLDSYGERNREESNPENTPTGDQEVLERLRSLGYIQ